MATLKHHDKLSTKKEKDKKGVVFSEIFLSMDYCMHGTEKTRSFPGQAFPP